MTRKSQGSFFQALPPRLQTELREAYADAVRDGRKEFRAIGLDWVTHYVKYLLEYEDSKQ
jgi:hypothetical protein